MFLYLSPEVFKQFSRTFKTIDLHRLARSVVPMVGLDRPVNKTPFFNLDRVSIIETKYSLTLAVMQGQRILDAMRHLAGGRYLPRLKLYEKLAFHKLDGCTVKIKQGLKFMGPGFHKLILSEHDTFRNSGHGAAR